MKVNSVQTNSIAMSRKEINRNYSTMSITQPNHMDTVSFGASGSFESRVSAKKPTGFLKGVLGWHLLGGIENAQVQVTHEMEMETLDAKNKIAIAEAQLEANKKYVEQLEQEHARTEAAKQAEIEAHNQAAKAYQETIFHQQESINSKNELIEATKEANAKLQAALAAQNDATKKYQQENEQLYRQMQEAQRQNDAQLQDALKIQMQEMEKRHSQDMKELLKNIEKAGHVADVFGPMVDLANEKGFKKIAGYQEQKDILMDHIGTPIALEKSGKAANVPGGILFFGPKGNGKTTFADAFAGQLNCQLVKLKWTFDENKNLDNFQKCAEDAQKRFEKDRTRSIILINEFDIFAPKRSKIAGILKDQMDTLSQDYHCTVFATTNFPEEIDDILIRDKRFYKVGLPPANKFNAAAVIKHYASPYADSNINYDELAEHIVKTQPIEAYSNARIENLVRTFVETTENIGKKITHGDLLKTIQESIPDISNEALETFKKQLEYAKRL